MPLVLSFAQEGMGWEIGGMAIVKGAKHPVLAKAWFDWALEPAMQDLGPKYAAYQAPTVKGAKASAGAVASQVDRLQLRVCRQEQEGVHRQVHERYRRCALR